MASASEIDVLKSQNASLTVKVNQSESSLKDCKAELEGLRNFRTSASTTIAKLEEEIRLSSGAKELLMEMDKMRIENEELKSKLSDASKKKESLFGELSREELEQKIFEQSQALVAQGEKNSKLAAKLKTLKVKKDSMESDLQTFRATLVKGIDEAADPANFAHTSVNELLRIRMQKLDTVLSATAASTMRGGTASSTRNGGKNHQRPASVATSFSGSSLPSAGPRASRPNTTPATSGVTKPSTSPLKSADSAYGDDEFDLEDPILDMPDDVSGEGRPTETAGDMATSSMTFATAADKEIRKLKDMNFKLQKKLSDALDGLQHAEELHQSLLMMKDRNEEFANRIRTEKDNRSRANDEVARANEKVIQLSEHIEKLMVHLKHEAAAKVKANTTARQLEKESKLLRERVTLLNRDGAGKDRVIAELKEGSRILEDQLRLMDEKYIELRNKLDWTRTNSKKEVSKIQKEANELRKKWLMAGGVDVTVVKRMETAATSSGESIGPSLPSKMRQSTGHHGTSGSNGSPPSRTTKAGLMGARLQPIGKVSTSTSAAMADAPESPDHGLPWSDSNLDSLELGYGDSEGDEM